MRNGANLASADFEPSDEQLVTLSREAFAPVRDRHREALAQLRVQVSALRRQALARVSGWGASKNKSR